MLVWAGCGPTVDVWGAFLRSYSEPVMQVHHHSHLVRVVLCVGKYFSEVTDMSSALKHRCENLKRAWAQNLSTFLVW